MWKYLVLSLSFLNLTIASEAQKHDSPIWKVDWKAAEQQSSDSMEAALSGKYFFPEWINSTPYYYYNVRNKGYVNHYIVDARTGRRTTIITQPEKFAQQWEQLTSESIDPHNIKLYGYQFDGDDMSRFYIKRKGHEMCFDIATQTLTKSKMPAETKLEGEAPRRIMHHTTDSLYTMIGYGYDIYLRDNTTGKTERLTTDGMEDNSYTYRLTKDSSENAVNGQWFGHRYVALITDQSEIKEEALINSLAKGRPTFKVFKMPMPGDKGIKRYRLYWYDADHRVGRMLPIDKYQDQIVDLNYFQSDSVLFFTRKSRTYDRIDLCRIRLDKGEIEEVISEETKPHINLQLFNYKILNGGQQFLWWSERTGRGNYYLYDHRGKLIRRVTTGDNLVAGPIAHIDTKEQTIIFAGYGQEKNCNPYYTYYYRASLKGKRQQLLTPGNGTHRLTLSPDGHYAVDVYSRSDLAPVMRTLSVQHPQHNFLVDTTDISDLRKRGWKAPTLVKVTAADGKTPLYGVMYTPTNLDINRKYPIISNVYPGPQDDQVPRSFAVDDNGNQSLAELGFIVINVPSRGSSPLRGRDFYNYGYGNLRDYPLADDRHTIEQLATRYPFIDLDRVGIYGHSGGGFEAATAILTSPDFYKVAVAASGNYDNNIYIQWWGELFHGLEQVTDSVTGKTTFRSNIPTTLELAPNLKGRLLLITGDVDNNVLPSSTYRLANALIEANKRFDMFVLPGKDHGVACPYYNNLIRYYFVENLLNPESFHIDIINHH